MSKDYWCKSCSKKCWWDWHLVSRSYSCPQMFPLCKRNCPLKPKNSSLIHVFLIIIYCKDLTLKFIRGPHIDKKWSRGLHMDKNGHFRSQKRVNNALLILYQAASSVIIDGFLCLCGPRVWDPWLSDTQLLKDIHETTKGIE